MIEQRADQWLSTYNWETDTIDYDSFLDYYELDYDLYDLAHEVFEHLLGWNHWDEYKVSC